MRATLSSTLCHAKKVLFDSLGHTSESYPLLAQWTGEFLELENT